MQSSIALGLACRSRCVIALMVFVAALAAVDAHATDYDIEVELDPVSHRLHGVERIRWTNVSGAATQELVFHLYLNAFASSQTTFMRELGWSYPESGRGGGWGWTRIDRLVLDDGTDLLAAMEFVRPDDGNPADNTLARVRLPNPVRAGEVVELELEFEAQLPWIIARTGHAGDFHLVGQWFPKLAVLDGDGWNAHQFHATSEFFSDFGTYLVAMTLPGDWVLAATGIEIDDRVIEQGRRRVVYRAERVHDFAWCAAPSELMEVVETDFEPGRDVPMVWFERALAMLDRSPADLELPPMTLRLLVPRTQRDLVPRMVRAARMSVAWFGLRFGPYPYPQLTIVSPPDGARAAAGMEYPTFITTGADRLDAYPPFSWSAHIESITAHEFGHQYFQGLVASNEFEDAWLDEGIASYAENSFLTEMVADGLAPRLLPISFWATERLATTKATVPLTAARSAWQHPSIWSYYLASNFKTSVALKTLEGLIGRTAMARGLRRYVDRFRFGHPSGDDLVTVLSETTGEDLSWFFNQAISDDADADWGVLSVDQQPHRKARGLKLNGSARTESDAEVDFHPGWLVEIELVRRGELVGPVDVELGWADGTTERRVWGGTERWVRWQLDADHPLASVVVDPDGVWALETRRADNYWRATTRWAGHPLWWLRPLGRLLASTVLRLG